MRRIARYLWVLAMAASVLAWFTIGVIWLRSYSGTDFLAYESANGYTAICSARGDVVVQLNPGDALAAGSESSASWGWRYLRMSPYTAPKAAVAYSYLGRSRTFGERHVGPVAWYTVRDAAGVGTVTATAPLWLPAVAAALPTLSWACLRLRRMQVRRRRDRAGQCRTCGYDLRGTPARCPECGTPAQSS